MENEIEKDCSEYSLCHNNESIFEELKASLRTYKLKMIFREQSHDVKGPQSDNISLGLTDHEPPESYWKRFLKGEIEEMGSLSFWRECFVEYVATLLLCFYHIGILLFMPGVDSPPLLHVSIGHGLFVAAVVTALGATGGCHMNPAVTLAFLTLREVGIVRALVYVIFQCAGAITGAVMVQAISHPSMVAQLGLVSPGADIPEKQIICTEVIISGFLMIVVTATSDKRRTDITGSVPLIVGLTVCVNTLLANKVSGSCMNPARALGPMVVKGNYNNLWIYCLGPCCGTLIGAQLYNLVLAPQASLKTSLKQCHGWSLNSENSVKEDRNNIPSDLDTLRESNL